MAEGGERGKDKEQSGSSLNGGSVTKPLPRTGASAQAEEAQESSAITAPSRLRTPGPRSRFRAAIGILIAVAVAALCLALIFYLKDNDYLRDDYPYVHNSYDWANFEQFYPVADDDFTPLPANTGDRVSLPRVQYDFSDSNSDSDRKEVLTARASAVKSATRKTWRTYSKHAMPHDELNPIQLSWTDPLSGWGATMVDGLDTLWIMDMKEEFYHAVREVALIDWADERFLACNIFETTIRYLGGLLSAYDLSGLPVLLNKARDLGDMLLVAFDTPNRIPSYWFNYDNARQGTQTAGLNQGSASATSLCLEFTRLAQLTGKDKYYDAVHRVSVFLASTQNSTLLPGMWPAQLDFRDMTAEGTDYTLGAGADSLYEYLLKMHILLSGADPVYESMYEAASEAARKALLFRPMVPTLDGESPDVLLSGSASVTFAGAEPDLVPKAQHLSCFTGGMFALGGKILNNSLHVDVGGKLARGCSWAYNASNHGIMPEAALLAPCPGDISSVNGGYGDDSCAFNLTIWQDYSGGTTKDGPFTDIIDGSYILRPEAIESLFILYRITGNPEFQDLAWDMWLSIVNVTETEHAFAAAKDVTVDRDELVELDDDMESFWVAETLKYFYLIFEDPGTISLDDWVFNTEAHPFKRSWE
ncbi:glycoside hydrolase family 47 protein [Zalerion maritima]|uniref:alpha-1,2-Mannosidase n=1 Tax=Zalerion maritima TaxID=339359 RepID=A0AAD5RP68_9PEZI|nr:glycoside hydrolase family 47 protein [Zalerion maritima]